jgi:sodium transport system permease protein
MAVLVPLIVYSWLALRWAIEQFRSESVLFRESERFDLIGWAIHLVRDRPPTPGAGEALLCFVLMLVAAWGVLPFMAGSLAGMVLGQVGIILAPAVLMALLLTANPRRTLKLRWPRFRYLAVAVALAVVAFPLVGELRVWVEWFFPAPEAVKTLMRDLGSKIPNLATGILVLALVPAVCEEVAFRGFILSGFQGEHRQRSAIVISAFLFGFMHVLLSLFQQLFNATLLGIVLGLLAVRSHSLLPGIVFHFLNNAQAVLLGEVTTNPRWQPLASLLFRDQERGLYDHGWLALGALATVGLLTWLYFDGKSDLKPAVGIGPRSRTRWRTQSRRSNRSASRNRTDSRRNWSTAQRRAMAP